MTYDLATINASNPLPPTDTADALLKELRDAEGRLDDALRDVRRLSIAVGRASMHEHIRTTIAETVSKHKRVGRR
jgi:hypothetical protein